MLEDGRIKMIINFKSVICILILQLARKKDAICPNTTFTPKVCHVFTYVA